MNTEFKNLSMRTKRVLIRAGIQTNAQLESKPSFELLKLPDFGYGRMQEVDVHLGRVSVFVQAEIDKASSFLRGQGYEVTKIK